MRLADTLTLLTLTLFALTQTPLFTIATDYEHEFDDVLKKEFYLMKSQKSFGRKIYSCTVSGPISFI